MYDQSCCVCFTANNGDHYKLQDQITTHSSFKVTEYIEYIVGETLNYESSSCICNTCLKLLNELDEIELRAKDIKLKFQEFVSLADLKTTNILESAENKLDIVFCDKVNGDEDDCKPSYDDLIQKNDNITKKEAQKKIKRHFECPVCEKSFVYKISANNHLKKQHKDVYYQYEDYFNKTDKPNELLLTESNNVVLEFDIKDDASLYLENDFDLSDIEIKNKIGKKRRRKVKVLKEAKLLQCPECPKKWKSKAELKHHKSSHSKERPFICEICGQAYKHKTAFSVHIGMHNGINPFACVCCKKTFTQKGALIRHMPIHTGEMPFQCDLCGKRFKYHTSFNIHQLTHTGEKSYKCELCGLALMSGSHLKRHMRIHTGEKRYSCSICLKRFAEKYNLAAHEKLHVAGSTALPKRNFRCQICSSTYDRRIKLDEHLAFEHQQEKLSKNTTTFTTTSTEDFLKHYKSNNSRLEQLDVNT